MCKQTATFITSRQPLEPSLGAGRPTSVVAWLTAFDVHKNANDGRIHSWKVWKEKQQCPEKKRGSQAPKLTYVTISKPRLPNATSRSAGFTAGLLRAFNMLMSTSKSHVTDCPKLISSVGHLPHFILYATAREISPGGDPSRDPHQL